MLGMFRLEMGILQVGMTDVFKYSKGYFVKDGAELCRVVPEDRTIKNGFEL